MQNDNIEFLDFYPPSKTIDKSSFVFLLPTLNIIVLIFASLLTGVILINKGTTYSIENPYLYEKINTTDNADNFLIFNGNEENNYISYNNLLWRIVRVNKTGTMTIILDDSINILPQELGEDYNINNYLNTTFLNQLDKSMLVENALCNDVVTDLNNTTCEDIYHGFVSLPDINTFVSTINNNNTFITKENEMIWLLNKYDNNKSWHTYGNKIAYTDNSNFYEIKPIVTLKKDIPFTEGNGSKESPYLVKTNSISMGSKVRINQDEYYVLSIDDTINLISTKTIESDYTYSGKYQEMTDYLNSIYLNSLPYKNILQEKTQDIYSIKDNKITKQTSTAKISIPNLYDFKFSSDIKEYYTSTKINNYILVYDNPIIYGTKNNSHHIRPIISISKDNINNLKLENGIYILEEV